MRKVTKKEPKKIILNDLNLMEFFQQFYSPIEKFSEYLPKLKELDCQKALSEVLANMDETTRLNFEKLKHNENYSYITSDEEVSYGKIRTNLKLVYGEHKNVDNYIGLFNNVHKFLTEYIQIDGIERLFSENYFNIEWNLYMEIDFEKNKKQIYRDHFVHQIRDAYFGYKLLCETNLYEDFIQCIKDRPKENFAKFINMHSKKEAIRRYLENRIIYEEIGLTVKENSGKNKALSHEENINKIQSVVIEEIIFKSWFLAALFHDIGYPVAYYYRLSRELDKYMPYLRVMDNHTKAEFIELTNILSGCYLFKAENLKEIEELYYKNDHGTLSAICFLLNFYNTGIINGLSESDKCIIELAAEAIFLHTREYSVQGKKSAHARMYFHQNPIAYLLRMCDDLQEWERLFFTVDTNSNILICDKCKTAVRKVEKISEDDSLEEEYYCKCGNKFERITAFNYRKINFIELCKQVTIEMEGDNYKIDLDYDLFKQLEVLIVNKDFAKYRISELANLKKLFVDQIYLPSIDFSYSIDYNPIALKCEILARYIKKIYSSKENSSFEWTWELDKYVNLIKENIGLLFDIESKDTSKKNDIMQANKLKIENFYLPLLVYKKSNEKGQINNAVKGYISENTWKDKWIRGENEEIEEIVNDYLKPDTDRFKDISKNDAIISSIKSYVDKEMTTSSFTKLDFYDELYIFKKLNLV